MNVVEYKNVTVQLEPEMLEKLDARVDRMDLNRSQYLRRLIRRELGIPTLELTQPELKGHHDKKHEEVPA